MRNRLRAAVPALILAAFSMSACASVDLDPGGPDPAFVRYVRVVEAQREHDRAAAACRAIGASASTDACRRRELIAANLRRQGYCHHPGDPAAEDPAARYDLWTACGAARDRAYASRRTQVQVQADNRASSVSSPSDR